MPEPVGDHIHCPEDGRGLRNVYVDGQLIDRAIWADTQLGLVVAGFNPPRICPDQVRVDSYPIWGDVRVEAIEQ